MGLTLADMRRGLVVIGAILGGLGFLAGVGAVALLGTAAVLLSAARAREDR